MQLDPDAVQGSFFVPVGFNFTQGQSSTCLASPTTELLFGMLDYADALGEIADVQNNVGAFGTAFGGSSGSQQAYTAFY